MSRLIETDTLPPIRQVFGRDTTLYAGATTPGDSLRIAGADSIPAIDTLPIAPQSPFREVEAKAFFGANTSLAQQPHQTSETSSTPGAFFFQGFVLLLILFYIRFIIQNALEVRFLITQPFKDALTGKQRLYDEQNNISYLRFLDLTGVVGLLFLGCILAENIASQVALPVPAPVKPLLITLVVALVGMGVLLLQQAALRLTGLITLTQPFIRHLLLLKRTYFALLALIATPLLLFATFTPGCDQNIWEWLIIAELCLLTFLFLKESLTLFLSQKVSILHWILYLCIVECLPISFILLNVAVK